MTTYISEEATYHESVYLIEDGEPVDGGADGPVNIQAKHLADRTKYLKQATDALRVDVGTYNDEDSISERLDAIEDELHDPEDGLEPRVAALETHVGTYNDGKGSIATRLDGLDTIAAGLRDNIGVYTDTDSIAVRLDGLDTIAAGLRDDIGVYTDTDSIADRLDALEAVPVYNDTALVTRIGAVETDMGNYPDPAVAGTVATRLSALESAGGFDDSMILGRISALESDIGAYPNPATAGTVAARLDDLEDTVAAFHSGVVVTPGSKVYKRVSSFTAYANLAWYSSGAYRIVPSSSPLAYGDTDAVHVSMSSQDGNPVYTIIGASFRSDVYGSVNMIRSVDTNPDEAFSVYKNGVLVQSGTSTSGDPIIVLVENLVPGDMITALSYKSSLTSQFAMCIAAL